MSTRSMPTPLIWVFSCCFSTVGLPHYSIGSVRVRASLFAAAALAMVLAVAGCGSDEFIPVSGKVTDLDGKVIDGLAGAQIEFESTEQPFSAVGEIQTDGSFVLLTANPGDGAVKGKHRILIARMYYDPERAAPRVIDAKYESFETSGLEVDISPEKHHFELKVERYKSN